MEDQKRLKLQTDTEKLATATPQTVSPRPALVNRLPELTRGRGGAVGLGCISLAAIFFLAVVAFGLAYQTRPSYKIDLGEKLDQPFVSNFNTREHPNGTSFRWSRGTSQLDLPGLGSQPLSVTVRYTPSANPNNPQLTVIVNEKNQAALSPAINEDGWLVQSFHVPAAWFADGHLHLKFQTTPFHPPGDPRELGLAFDWVAVAPADSGQVFIRPPDSVFLTLILTAVISLVVFFSIGLPAIWAVGSSMLVIGGLSYWLTSDRLSLTSLLQRDFIRVLFFLAVSAYLLAEYAPRIYRRLGLPASRMEGGWLAGLFVLEFTVLYFVQLHPLFSTSDLGLNEHNLQRVLHGQLVLTEDLPNQQPAPYPPAFYIMLAPFTFFSGTGDAEVGTLITLANCLLTASGVFLIYYLAGLLRGPLSHLLHLSGKTSPLPLAGVSPDWTALLAATFYATSRYQFLIFSQGNHTNLFGAWAFLLFLCVIGGTLSQLRHPRPRLFPIRNEEPISLPAPRPEFAPLSAVVARRGWERAQSTWRNQIWPRLQRALRYLLPLAALLLAFFAHYGTFLFANAFVIVYIAVLMALGGREAWRDILYLAVGWGLGLVIAFIVLYYNFTGEITAQLSGSGASAGRQRGSLDLIEAARRFYSSCRDDFGLIVLIAALGGLGLYLTRRLGRKDWWRLEPVGAALVALALTSLAFALLETVQHVESRYQLYLVTALVIPAGYLLGRVWRSGGPGRLLVIALFAFQFLSALLFWLDRVTYYLQY